jgi:hypothetical protein
MKHIEAKKRREDELRKREEAFIAGFRAGNAKGKLDWLNPDPERSSLRKVLIDLPLSLVWLFLTISFGLAIACGPRISCCADSGISPQSANGERATSAVSGGDMAGL